MTEFRGRTNGGMIMIPEEEFKEARDREDAAVKALARIANKKHALQSRVKELEAINLGLTKTMVEMEAENAELRAHVDSLRLSFFDYLPPSIFEADDEGEA